MKRASTSTKRSKKSQVKKVRRTITPFSKDHMYLVQHPQGIRQHFRRYGRDAYVGFNTTTGQLGAFNVDTGIQAPWINNITSPISDVGTSSSTVSYGIGCAFALTDIPQSAEFTSLFNEYQLDKIVMEITPLSNWGALSGIGGQLPDVYWVNDPNDATAPGSSGQLQQYDNCRHDNMDHKLSYAIIPRAAQQLYATTLFTSYGYQSSNKSIWIDCSSPSAGTPHYGLKLFIRNFININGSGQCWRFQPVYYFTCRRTR